MLFKFPGGNCFIKSQIDMLNNFSVAVRSIINNESELMARGVGEGRAGMQSDDVTLSRPDRRWKFACDSFVTKRVCAKTEKKLWFWKILFKFLEWSQDFREPKPKITKECWPLNMQLGCQHQQTLLIKTTRFVDRHDFGPQTHKEQSSSRNLVSPKNKSFYYFLSFSCTLSHTTQTETKAKNENIGGCGTAGRREQMRPVDTCLLPLCHETKTNQHQWE